jgi:hypothetical protein
MKRYLNKNLKELSMLNFRFRHGFALATLPLLLTPIALVAQSPATSKLGTVKAIDGNKLTVTTAAGDITVTVAPNAPVLQLPPGSKSLKDAAPAQLADVAVGDRVLATGQAGDAADALTASRVVLMKSTDIAALRAAEQRQWQRGLGGLVKSVDGTTITVVAGAKMLKIETTPTTTFKHYAEDSVDFADAKASSLATIHPGDQLRARGTVADDRLSMTAVEVVTGTFENLSGVISSVDATGQTLTLKDLATKKVVTVYVTPKSDLRNLPATAAAAFAARNRPAGAAGTAPGAASGPPAGGAPGAGGPGAGGPGAGRPRSAGLDLSQMLSHLPTETLADLKAGQAVMIVASPADNGHPTAITLLSGVEGILSATPAGQSPLTLSPWNISEPEGAGGGGEGGGPGAGGAGAGVK